MAAKVEAQIGLFETPPIRFEYYPVLLPDDNGMAEIATLNKALIEHGIKSSNLPRK